MAMNDEQLLNFDKERLAHWDEERAARALSGANSAIYRNHLEIAQWIDGWIERMEEGDVGRRTPEHQSGLVAGVREIAAHLRQADFVPDGDLLRD
ncbi:hypothetical protein [Streptomyces sp. IB2014 016-6]|uniref:hypothetical protein n=1 Tax=Streptomyces sp. IB2014 016-6 TaxID=2517818 RepID=UPI0011C94A42|nr:hypothetical protein [Streptomyces sp. IB2014 016-6]TXL91591.1 hypothetical protein EW053_04495 [Streptomyces sp. IB2014 016-6]